MPPRKNPARVSPTAHYTGYVWYRHGMSNPALATRTGRLFHAALRGPELVSRRLLAGPSLEALLLRRHRVIDHLLTTAIASGEVGQVLEIAAGLSPRGLRLMDRYGTHALRYVEADLPAMAARKHRTMAEAGLLCEGHTIVALDALHTSGPLCLEAIAQAHLDPSVGTAIITEGLLNYFDGPTRLALWSRLAGWLAAQPAGGVYLADLSLGDETLTHPVTQVFARLLDRFASGVYLDLPDVAAAERALRQAGFTDARLHLPARFESILDLPPIRGQDVVRIVEARCR
ncbi:MAG: class I SAM-dependent methyltransferase [Deltaproteobacteria bacterium]|nr:class I SAM-dependent methyltransferase [Deltaproteobacteria bacterium]MCB9789070.1 class I SAM-dependent methyltransferase [Deltaproteobacteria bacterium]